MPDASTAADASAAADFERAFPGESEMARRMRALDWSRTELGSPTRWPHNLRFAVRLCLASRFPILLWWGPRLCVLYNDAYLPFFGEFKRAGALMQPGRKAWREIWDTIGPRLASVMATGISTASEDEELFVNRALPKEEVFVTSSCTPIVGADGRTVEGIFWPCADNTEKVVAARRLETLRKLGARSSDADTVQAACERAVAVLGQNPRDIPFAAIYVAAGNEASLAASVLPPTDHRLPPYASGTLDDAGSPWPLAKVLRTKQAADCLNLPAKGVRIAGGPWPELTRRAVVAPMPAPREGLAGLLVAGVSPRRPLDAAYRTFIHLIARHIACAISEAQADVVERKRAEALAAADRAKAAAREAADLIELRRAGEKVRASEECFRRYFDMGLIGAALTSREKGILEVNDELCRILGYPREELLRKTWAELTHPEDLAADAAQFERVLAGESDAYTLDKRFIRKDGSVIDSIMAARAVRRADGRVDYFIGLVQDITARKRAEESLQRLQAELAHAARVTTMGEMASSIAHEINQPLAAIVANARACARWLAMEPANLEEAKAAAGRIVRDANRATDVMARIRAFVQRREMQRARLDLGALVGEALGMAEAEIRRHGVSLNFSAAAELPAVMGDRVQLQQVVLNLLKNALEAMEPVTGRERRLEIRVQAEADELRVAVRDFGQGIEAGQRERVFDAFHTTKPSGMGMGLAISRSIVEAHGGRLWVADNDGPGVTFAFTLPRARQDSGSAEQSPGR